MLVCVRARVQQLYGCQITTPGAVSLSTILDPGIEPSPSGSQSKTFAHRTCSSTHVSFDVYETYKPNSLI